MKPGGFYIEEMFQFEKKWYGVLRIEDNKNFKKIVHITNIYPGGCDWLTISSETMEKTITYFYEKDKKNELK